MKKLLAIAVAAALVAPAAAMADTTLYGKLHASVNQTKVTGAKTTTGVVNNASRIGVKGATALDNGMEAIYGVEMDVRLDGEGTNMSARNQFVGLKGGFGEVRVGRHDTPAKLATAGQDIFADTAADFTDMISVDGHRVNNAVAYINKFGPVGFGYAHTTGLTSDNRADADSLMVNYSNGPWYAGLGHTAFKAQPAVAAVAAVPGNAGQAAVAAAAKTNVTNLGLGWKAEAGHQVNLVTEQSKPSGGVKTTGTVLNGVYKMGNVSLKGQTGQRKATGGVKTTSNTIGVDYSLGKKTAVYGLVDQNKTGAAKTTVTSVGLVTEF